MRELTKTLVLCDVDNTLLTVQSGIPSCNKAVIRLFQKMGGRFTLATGRTPPSVKAALDGIQLNAPAVCCGGSVLYDFEMDAPLSAHYLNREQAEWALFDLMKKFPEAGVEVMANGGQIYMVRSSWFTEYHLHNEKIGCEYAPVFSLPQDWEKVLFAADPKTIDQMREYARADKYGTDIEFIATNTTYFEIMPKGVSKTSGMQELCDLYGLQQADTVMIGDYFNDLDLLRAAGTGVAVANAPREVKMAADVVTTCRCCDGAVGEYLYAMLKECGV